ncbi:ABC transporter substrate-binding protein [Homoserinimonas sp. A447]
MTTNGIMRTPVRRMLAGVAAFALLGGLAACASSEPTPAANPGTETEQELITVRLSYNVGTSTLPIVVADRLGMWEENGIDFVGTEITPGPAGIASLGQQSDVLQTTQQSSFEAVEKGLPLRIFAGVGNSTTELPSFPVFTNDKSVKDFGDLSGTTLGVPSLTGFATTAMDYMIDKQGGDSAKTPKVVVPWETQADQLKANQVSAVWSITPHAVNLEKQGYKALGDPTLLATGQDELLASVLVTTADYAEANPEALRRVKATMIEAVQWVKDNDAEAKDMLMDWIGLSKDLVVGHPLTNWKIDITADDLAPMQRLYAELGMLPNLPPMKEILVDLG